MSVLSDSRMPPRSAGKSSHVLAGALRTVVVDDNPSIRSLLTQFLGLAGHAVVGEGADGSAAVESVAVHHPDAVIIDWQMPVMDGIEAVRRIRSSSGADDVAIVMFSSRGGTDAAEVASAAGVDAYVDKFTDLDVLLDVLEAAASARRTNLRRGA